MYICVHDDSLHRTTEINGLRGFEGMATSPRYVISVRAMLYFFHFLYSTVPCWKFGSPYLGKAQQPQELRYPFLSVCVVLPCVRQWCGWQCLRFLTCTQTLMHAIAHGGCTDTVRESALKFGSGRKIPSRPRDSNPRQHCACVQVLSGTFFVLLERPPRDLLMRDLPDESLFIYFISYINVSM